LGQVDFKEPERPVVHNFTAEMSPSDPDEIRNILKNQLCNQVKWYDSVCKLVEAGVKNYVEIGPGKVLTGLVRKIVPKDAEASFYSVNSLKALEKFFDDIS
jgi:[acyl-carrier-protein] S-malonyltransferase